MIFKIKRRAADGQPGAPSAGTLLSGELAYNEADDILYYAAGQEVISIGGEGSIATLTGSSQTISNTKTFTDTVNLSAATADTKPLSANDNSVATAEFVHGVFDIVDGGEFDEVETIVRVGKYWYSTSLTAWNTQSNWYTDVTHSIQATTLPNSATDVILLGEIAPVVDLDAQYWIQPNSINSTQTGITFTSLNNNTVTCSITGNATFINTATYGEI